ncbi:unnamed protein product, partial [Allacma fusca]
GQLMGMTRGGNGSAPLAKPEDISEVQNPEEVLLSQLIPCSNPSKVNDNFKIDDQPETGKSANDPCYLKYHWILFIIFLLVITAMIVTVILLNFSKNTETVTNFVVNELIGPTAGPYYHIDLSGFGGKLQGISNKYITYLEVLGVKSVIISQILEFDDSSAKGVMNFKKVDVEYGDQSTFTDLVSRLKEKGMKVILQFIPNHSSIQHDWFANRSIRDNYYVTINASQNSSWASHATPNNVGSAWTEDPANENVTFLHQFTTMEPDLNFRSPDVIREINGALEFWYSLGVDGFLLSKVSHLIEDLNELNNQSAMVNQPSNAIVVKEILDSSNWNFNGTQDLRKAIENTMSVAPRNPVHWQVGSLTSRPSTKFGKERSQALTLVAALLPGQLVLNYGDEIGLSAGGSYQELNLDDPSVQFFRQTLKASIAQTRHGSGTSQVVTTKSNPGMFLMKRYFAENAFIVAVNFGAEQASFSLESFKDSANVVVATPNSAVEKTVTAWEIQLPTNSAVALEVRNA